MSWIAPLLVLAVSWLAAANDVAAQIKTVTPKVVKPGDVVTVTGVSLGDDHVEDVYLTDHKFDIKCKVLEQNDKMIKFRINPLAKSGRMQLLMLLKPEKEGEDPQLLELPAYVLVEEVSTEITQVQGQDKGKKTTQSQQK